MILSDTLEAARQIRTLLSSKGIPSVRDPEGKSLGHALFMAEQISSGDMDNYGKVMRWYGYLQALLVFHGLSSLDAEKIRNIQS